MLFDYNIGKYKDGISLMELLKSEELLKRFPKLYLPEVETYENGRMFINNGSTVFIKESGAVKVRFVLFDTNGRAITTPESAFTQLNLKQAMYLARFSCPVIGMTGPNLTCDYFVNIFEIQFSSSSTMHMQEAEKGKNTKVTEIIEDYQYRFISIPSEPSFDPIVSQFETNRDEIINRYFR